MKQFAKRLVNRGLSLLGARAVGQDWGPRGFQTAFWRLKQYGFVPRQIVDVGASDGRWTYECMRIFPETAYFLVDPLQENFAALRQLEQRSSCARVWLGALGAADGVQNFHIHGDQSSFLSSEFASADTRAVHVRTLDSFAGTEYMQFAPDLIKADVQGYELEVLRGAEECLNKSVQYVLLEVSYQQIYLGCPLADEVIAFMRRHGFRIYDVCTYTQRPRDSELVQSDVLFARDGAKVFEVKGYA